MFVDMRTEIEDGSVTLMPRDLHKCLVMNGASSDRFDKPLTAAIRTDVDGVRTH